MLVGDSYQGSEWPLEATLVLANFLMSHLFSLREDPEHTRSERDIYKVSLEVLERRLLLSFGLSAEDYSRLADEARMIEKERGYSSASTVLEYCIAKSPNKVKTACLEYALTCATTRTARQQELLETAKRYGLHPGSNKRIEPLQVVYGADFLSSKSSALLLPSILVFDHILSDEGIVFSDDKYYSRLTTDFRILKQEGILIPYDWATVFASVLYDNWGQIEDIERESEEIYLKENPNEEDKNLVPLLASHGYATSLKLSIPALVLPGDIVPNTLNFTHSASSLPKPEVASYIWLLEALGSILDGFTLSDLPMEEMLSIRHEVRKGDGYVEFREFALSEILRLKNELRGASFGEACKEIQFEIETKFKPTLNRLRREITEIDKKRNRKFLSKVREEGASLTINLIGLVFGPDRPKALTEISKTLYTSAEAGLGVERNIPSGFAFALKLSQQLEKALNSKPKISLT